MELNPKNIRNDWPVKTIGDVCIKVGSGVTPTGGEKVYQSDGRPFVRSQNVGWGTLNLDDVAFISESLHRTFDSTEIKEEDVLLNITGASIGRSAIATSNITGGNVNQHVCILRTDKKLIHPKLLNYLLLSNQGQKQIDNFQAGGNRQGLNFGQIKSIQFSIPPKQEEQIAIATALSDADTLIDSLEKLIAKKRLIKQGVMQKLLKPKEGWEVKILGESSNILRGGSPRPIEDFITTETNGVNWIKIGDVGKSAKYIDTTEEKISSKGMSRSRFVNEGDFLLSNSMSFGRPYILRTNGCIHDGWLVIQNYQNHFNRDFLYYVLGSESVLSQYKAMASGVVS